MPPAGSQGFVDWFFRSRVDGRITIAQFPNPPLWVFLGAVVAERLAPDGSGAATGAGWVGAGALLWWSVDEVVRGVNPWRRVLGVAGLAFTAARVARLA